ncbi:MAG: HAD family hydrolase [Bacilli bacterium]|nr:HAD family hydrolase [Bacilli bacterium]
MNAQGKVIATDLDGTLFYPKRRFRMIETGNRLFLRKFIDQGGRVVLVSGRNLRYLEKVKKRLKRPVDAIGCNGAFIKVDNQFIKKSHMNNQRLLKVLDDMYKRYKISGIFIMSEEHNFIVPKQEFGLFNRFGYFFYQLWQGIYKEKTIKKDELLHDALKHDKIYKIMIFFGPSKKKMIYCYNAMNEMIKLYPDFAFAYNGPSIEMSNSNATKALAVKQYLDYLKIKHDNVMVVGDSGNDISMFQTFKNSFCMAQASDEIKKEAKHIIHRVNEIEKYL